MKEDMNNIAKITDNFVSSINRAKNYTLEDMINILKYSYITHNSRGTAYDEFIITAAEQIKTKHPDITSEELMVMAQSKWMNRFA